LTESCPDHEKKKKTLHGKLVYMHRIDKYLWIFLNLNKRQKNELKNINSFILLSNHENSIKFNNNHFKSYI